MGDIGVFMHFWTGGGAFIRDDTYFGVGEVG